MTLALTTLPEHAQNCNSHKPLAALSSHWRIIAAGAHGSSPGHSLGLKEAKCFPSPWAGPGSCIPAGRSRWQPEPSPTHCPSVCHSLVECTQLCWSRGSWRILCTDRAPLAPSRATSCLPSWQRQCRGGLVPADLLQAGLSLLSSPGPRSHHPPAAPDEPWTPHEQRFQLIQPSSGSP